MKTLLAFVLTTLASLAWADDSPPSDEVIVNSVRCEAGRVGQQLIASGFPANLKAIVSWSKTRTESASGGLGFSFFHIGWSGDLGREQMDQLKSDGLLFNLHPANLAVCTGYKKDIIPEGLGVFDCLINQKLASLRIAVEGGAGSASCQYDVKISKKMNADLKATVWGIVEVGPSGSLGSIFDYNFLVAAPSSAAH